MAGWMDWAFFFFSLSPPPALVGNLFTLFASEPAGHVMNRAMHLSSLLLEGNAGWNDGLGKSDGDDAIATGRFRLWRPVADPYIPQGCCIYSDSGSGL